MSDTESGSEVEEVVIATTKPVRKSSRFQKLVEETTVKRKEKSTKVKEPKAKAVKKTAAPMEEEEPSVSEPMPPQRRAAIAPNDTNTEMMKMIFSLQQQVAAATAAAAKPKRRSKEVAPSGHPYRLSRHPCAPKSGTCAPYRWPLAPPPGRRLAGCARQPTPV